MIQSLYSLETAVDLFTEAMEKVGLQVKPYIPVDLPSSTHREFKVNNFLFVVYADHIVHVVKKYYENIVDLDGAVRLVQNLPASNVSVCFKSVPIALLSADDPALEELSILSNVEILDSYAPMDVIEKCQEVTSSTGLFILCRISRGFFAEPYKNGYFNSLTEMLNYMNKEFAEADFFNFPVKPMALKPMHEIVDSQKIDVFKSRVERGTR